MFNGSTIYRCSSLTGKVIYPETRAVDDEAAKLEEVRALHRWADDQPPARSKVYFVGGAEGPIKIGYTTNIIGRLRDLQHASAIELKILATRQGCRLRETAYHCQFADARLRGEWFERSPAIMTEIRKLRLAEKRAKRRALEEGSKGLWW